MPRYEYKVVPAPTKGQKAKGVKTPEGRFARSLQGVLNTEGDAGWEYLRAELLPSDERSGLTGSTTNWRNVLVFRRQIGVVPTGPRPDPIAVDLPTDSNIAPKPGVAPLIGAAEPAPVQQAPAVRMPAETPPAPDRKAENLITVSGMFAAQKSRDGAESSEDEASSASDEGPADRA